MTLQVSVERQAEQLVVKGRGEAVLADLKGFSDLIATLCREEGHQLVLVDLLDVTQHLSFTEHLQLGLYVAEKLGSLVRMATVVPKELRSGNSERAAQKTGMRLRTFTDLDEARAWLRDGVDR
jgi:hypothetical protein